MDICKESADLLAFRVCCFTLFRLYVVCSFPVRFLGRKWNSIVSVPDHCLFIYIGKEMVTFHFLSKHQADKTNKHEETVPKPNR